MTAKIRKGDLVEVVCGRLPDEKKPAERNAHRVAGGLEFLKFDDEGKQGCAIKVFPAKGTVFVEGVSLKTYHVYQGQNQTDGIKATETPISPARVAPIDPDTKQRTRVDLREGVVGRDGHTRKAHVRVMCDGVICGIEQGKEI